MKKVSVGRKEVTAGRTILLISEGIYTEL